MSGSSPRTPLDRLAHRGGSSRRFASQLYPFILGAAVAGLVAAAVVMSVRAPHLLGDCATALAEGPLPSGLAR